MRERESSLEFVAVDRRTSRPIALDVVPPLIEREREKEGGREGGRERERTRESE